MPSMDAALGLVYLRVPTWAPFRLQFYCNGHSWLARQMTAAGIGYTMADNAFVRIDDWPRAQQLADALSPDQLHRVLDHYAGLCCPVCEEFGQSWSEAEWRKFGDTPALGSGATHPCRCRGQQPPHNTTPEG